MWALHSCIPDLREEVKVDGQITAESLSFYDIASKYKLELDLKIKPAKIYFIEDRYHYRFKDEIFINIKMVIDIVGDEEVNVDGYILEILAYGFFDRAVRRSIVLTKYKRGRLFSSSIKSISENNKIKNQWHINNKV